MSKMNEDVFYDMARDFLKGGPEVQSRPQLVETALKHLKDIAPVHEQVLAEYIRRLEKEDDGNGR